MTIKSMILSLGMALFLVNTSSTVYAQDEEDSGHYYAVSTYQWTFNNLEEIYKAMEEDMDLVKQNEFIISRKVMTHAWAGNFSVMFIVEYASFEDVAKGQTRGGELYRAKYPDEAERKKRDDIFNALIGDSMHIDNIVQENTKLTK